MIARGIGGVAFFFDFAALRYPWRLWLLLAATPEDREALARLIWADPSCTFDKFSATFRQIFRSPRDLCSEKCLAVLEALAWLIRLCVSRIECRHASVFLGI